MRHKTGGLKTVSFVLFSVLDPTEMRQSASSKRPQNPLQ